MPDIANNQKNTVGIEDITSGNDMAVSSLGAASVAGAAADGASATPHPVIVGGIDPSGIIKTITGLDTFSVKSMCVVNVPVLSYLTNQNQVYSVALDVNAASAGTDNALVYIRNPNGSGKELHILRVLGGTSVTNVSDTFKVTHTPTVSVDGTSQTPVSRNVGGGAGAAVALVTTLPTVSNIGTVIENSVAGQNSVTVEIVRDEYSVVVQPNNALLITANPSSNNRLAHISVIWAEI